MKNLMLIRVLGVILLIVGFLINYIIGRRKFNRRAMTGFEGFRNYERAWFIRGVEKIGRIIGRLLILGGVLLILLTFV